MNILKSFMEKLLNADLITLDDEEFDAQEIYMAIEEISDKESILENYVKEIKKCAEEKHGELKKIENELEMRL